MKQFLKKCIPESVLGLYHKSLALIATQRYRHPSNSMAVIGVTGTAGKTTTIYMLARILEKAGLSVGVMSTTFFKIGKREWLNDKKMTMLGRFQLQRMLREMVDAGCQIAIIETTSEGMKQYRHLGINYDIALFTNLSEEHIEAHGSFENYRAAKLQLFDELAMHARKTWAEIPGNHKRNGTIQKRIIVNLDDANVGHFLKAQADRKYGYTFTHAKHENVEALEASVRNIEGQSISFDVNGTSFTIPVMSEVSAWNAVAAVTVGHALGIELHDMATALADLPPIPGRFELIDEGQSFRVMVDYAFTPEAQAKLYKTVRVLHPNRIIHVTGSTGGGRDKARRPKLGALAGAKADVVIVTDEDPYDDDPMEIINAIADAAVEEGKVDGQNLFRILDRREGIRKAIELAREGDLVLITGKGAEQGMMVKGYKKVLWDDRKVAREALQETARSYSSSEPERVDSDLF